MKRVFRRRVTVEFTLTDAQQGEPSANRCDDLAATPVEEVIAREKEGTLGGWFADTDYTVISDVVTLKADEAPRETTHMVSERRLGQLDLPAVPGFLTAVRVVEANVPRIVGPDWLFIHSPITFTIDLPDDLAPGMVVEWDDAGDAGDYCLYTVVTRLTAGSVTFAHFGRGPDAALSAARYANTTFRREGE